MNSLGTNRIRSCGSFTQRHGAYQPSETVSRSRRISFESHPSILSLQDLAINDEEGADGEVSLLGADSAGGLNQEDEDLLDIILEQVEAVPRDNNADSPQRNTGNDER